MARRMSAEELREEARKLMEKARSIENKNYITIGQKAVELWRQGKIEDELKNEIEHLFNE